MIDFILMINKSDDNYLDKNLEPGITVQGVIKDDCSIENPVLKITGSNSILLYNYVVIPEFKRAYFIRDKVVGLNNYYEVYCEVDVLETYKDVIKNNPCIIGSTEQSGYNKYLRHESYVATVKHKTDILPFSTGLNNNGEFILITAGG